MDINNIFGIHEMALQVRTKRAQIIASNLANADTPGYKAKDINFKEAFENIKNQVEFNLNNFGSNNMNDLIEAEIVEASSMNAAIDKNSVDAHIEKGKMAQNSIQYMASLRFIEAKLKSLMTVIKGE